MEHKSMEMSPEPADYEIEEDGFEFNVCSKSFETEGKNRKL